MADNVEDNENFLNYAISTAMINVLPTNNEGLFYQESSNNFIDARNQTFYSPDDELNYKQLIETNQDELDNSYKMNNNEVVTTTDINKVYPQHLKEKLSLEDNLGFRKYSPEDSLGLRKHPPEGSLGLKKYSLEHTSSLRKYPPEDSLDLRKYSPEDSLGLRKYSPEDSLGLRSNYISSDTFHLPDSGVDNICSQTNLKSNYDVSCEQPSLSTSIENCSGDSHVEMNTCFPAFTCAETSTINSASITTVPTSSPQQVSLAESPNAVFENTVFPPPNTSTVSKNTFSLTSNDFLIKSHLRTSPLKKRIIRERGKIFSNKNFFSAIRALFQNFGVTQHTHHRLYSRNTFLKFKLLLEI